MCSHPLKYKRIETAPCHIVVVVVFIVHLNVRANMKGSHL